MGVGKRLGALFQLGFTVVVAVGLAVSVQAYAVKPYRIPSPSMEPTLQVGDRVLVDRFTHRLGAEPKVGQVVVFNPPAWADDQRCGVEAEGLETETPCSRPGPGRSKTTFVKRVVGVAGDRLELRGGHVIRNGRREPDGYITPCGASDDCTFSAPVVVPPGHVYLMGDNRGNSNDSRFWGPVPVTWVIGHVVARYWPATRVGLP